MERPPIAWIITTGILWYILIFLELMFTAPVTSKDKGIVFGIPLAICLLLFGAQLMTRKGVRPGTCFVYGCGSVFIFWFRFLSDMGGTVNFGWWLKYQKISTQELVVMWVGISLFLGAVCAGVSKISSAGHDAGSLDIDEQFENSAQTLRSIERVTDSEL